MHTVLRARAGAAVFTEEEQIVGSYPYGKPEICEWIRQNFSVNSSVLDVGACNGKWRQLLPEYPNMDAVEAFLPNMDNLTGYRHAYNADIRGFPFNWYDLIIFGDIIEHLPVKDAQFVLEYARTRCCDMIIAVPYLYPQGEIYGNPYERHIQDDLTPDIFSERYPGYEPLWQNEAYAYYHKART